MMGLRAIFLSGWGATCFSTTHLKREKQNLTSSNVLTPTATQGRQVGGKESMSGLTCDLTGLGLNSH